MNTIYVLIMLWGGVYGNSGMTVIQQEFSSLEACEYARSQISKAHDGHNFGLRLGSQGCYKK